MNFDRQTFILTNMVKTLWNCFAYKKTQLDNLYLSIT